MPPQVLVAVIRNQRARDDAKAKTAKGDGKSRVAHGAWCETSGSRDESWLLSVEIDSRESMEFAGEIIRAMVHGSTSVGGLVAFRGFQGARASTVGSSRVSTGRQGWRALDRDV